MKNTKKLIPLLIIIVLAAGCKSKPDVTDTEDAVDLSRQVRNIFAGVADVFILREDNTLWAAGYNRAGQLGLGEVSARRVFQGEAPQGLPGGPGGPIIACIKDDTGNPVSGVLSVSAGESHALILKEDGTLWGAGDSSYGELGMAGGKLLRFTQLKAQGGELSGLKALAAGNNSTFYISADGSLWAAGYNYYGELGLGSQEAQALFIKVESAGQNIKALAAGIRHTVLLKEDGTLWAAGYNYNGQLGLDDVEDRNSFTEVKSAGSGISAVAAGNYHTVILKNDGSVWAAGSNYWGQIGFPDSADRQVFTRVNDEKGNQLAGVREIAARGDITVLLKDDGSLILAGNYTDTEGTSEPVFTLAEPKDVKSSFVPLIPERGADLSVRKVVLGHNSIYVIDSESRLWAAGSNRYGQLSIGLDTEASSTLKLIGQ